MSVYYCRLNMRGNRYCKSIDTADNTVIPYPAQPAPNPRLRAGLNLNETAGNGNGAVPAEQGTNTAGG